jgi:hypothetical protein
MKAGIILGLLAGIIFLIWSNSIGFGGDNMQITELGWSDCELGDAKITVQFTGVDSRALAGRGRELQCKMIIDGTDYYEQDGQYYCDIGKSLQTTFRADPAVSHTVQVCCSTKGLEQAETCAQKKLFMCQQFFGG